MAHNKAFEEHPRYRLDMKFTEGDARGNLVFYIHDKVINPEDESV